MLREPTCWRACCCSQWCASKLHLLLSVLLLLLPLMLLLLMLMMMVCQVRACWSQVQCFCRVTRLRGHRLVLCLHAAELALLAWPPTQVSDLTGSFRLFRKPCLEKVSEAGCFDTCSLPHEVGPLVRSDVALHYTKGRLRAAAGFVAASIGPAPAARASAAAKRVRM